MNKAQEISRAPTNRMFELIREAGILAERLQGATTGRIARVPHKISKEDWLKRGREDFLQEQFIPEYNDAPMPENLDARLVEALRKTNPNKALGVDGISSRVWLTNPCFEVLLKRIKAQYAANGRSFPPPQTWLTSKMVPIYKKGSTGGKRDPRSYRLISVRCHAVKALARLIDMNNKEVGAHQAAQKGRTTGEHIQSLWEYITEKSEAPPSSCPSYIVFIDVKAAFPSVNHEGLWKVLQKELAPWELKVASDLISGQATIVAREVRTEAFLLGSGVREGCPASPLFFNMVLNAIVRKTQEKLGEREIVFNLTENLRSYMDDLAIMFTATSKQIIRSVISTLEETAEEYGLFFNRAKSAIMQPAKTIQKVPKVKEKIDRQLEIQGVKCDDCGRAFPCRKSLPTHLSRWCPVRNPENANWDRSRLNQVAYKKIERASTIKRKWQQMTENFPYKCARCGAKFASMRGRSIHESRMGHKSENPQTRAPPGVPDQDALPFQCLDCNRKFMNEHGLKIHRGHRARSGRCPQEPKRKHKNPPYTPGSHMSAKRRKVIIFEFAQETRPNPNLPAETEPILNGFPFVRSYKYLGVNLCADGDMSELLTSRISLAQRPLAIFLQLWSKKMRLPINKIRFLVKVFVVPIVMYGLRALDLTGTALKQLKNWARRTEARILGVQSRSGIYWGQRRTSPTRTNRNLGLLQNAEEEIARRYSTTRQSYLRGRAMIEPR